MKKGLAMYTLDEGEKVDFELRIVSAVKQGAAAGMIRELLAEIPVIGPLLCGSKSGAEGVFVLTSTRVMMVLRTASLFNCAENRSFWSFPRASLTGWLGYAKSRKCCCSAFALQVGFCDGATSIVYNIESPDVETDEQAQAVIGKLTAIRQPRA